MSKLSQFEHNCGTQIQPGFRQFLEHGPYDIDDHIDVNQLKVWPTVSTASSGTDRPEDEDSQEYWIHDVAQIHRLIDIEGVVDEAYSWSKPLGKLGYPVASDYGGGVYFQTTEGEIWHGFGDEWIYDEDHKELADAGLKAFLQDWGHHYVADDYKAFYKMLCEQRGAK